MVFRTTLLQQPRGAFLPYEKALTVYDSFPKCREYRLLFHEKLLYQLIDSASLNLSDNFHPRRFRKYSDASYVVSIHLMTIFLTQYPDLYEQHEDYQPWRIECLHLKETELFQQKKYLRDCGQRCHLKCLSQVASLHYLSFVLL